MTNGYEGTNSAKANKGSDILCFPVNSDPIDFNTESCGEFGAFVSYLKSSTQLSASLVSGVLESRACQDFAIFVEQLNCNLPSHQPEILPPAGMVLAVTVNKF